MSKFELLWEQDSTMAIEFADEVAGSDLDHYRLLLYIGYYLKGVQGQEELTERIFEKVISVSNDQVRKNHARAVYAWFLEENGRSGEAVVVMREAADYTFANETIARDLWESGENKGAIEAYIRLAAGAPGYREHSKLDSLYAIVYPGATDLDTKLAAERIFEGRKLPDMEFVDIRGKRHSISGYRGKKLVITAFSPT